MGLSFWPTPFVFFQKFRGFSEYFPNLSVIFESHDSVLCVLIAGWKQNLITERSASIPIILIPSSYSKWCKSVGNWLKYLDSFFITDYFISWSLFSISFHSNPTSRKLTASLKEYAFAPSYHCLNTRKIELSVLISVNDRHTLPTMRKSIKTKSNDERI